MGVAMGSVVSPRPSEARTMAQSAFVTIFGDVKRPGEYQHEGGATVGALIERAGGLDGEALRYLTLVRGVSSDPKHPDNGGQLVVSRPTLETIVLPGDQLQVYAYKSDFVAPSAQRIVSLLAAGAFDLITITFDAKMRITTSDTRVRTQWQALQKQLGTFQRQAGVRVEIGRDLDYTGIVASEFAKGAGEVSVRFDRDGNVTGLSMAPVGP
jgi:hypothetical protein